MTKTIDFSVVVSTFNAAHRLQIFLDSYASQTWPERELIIVDGGSTDGTDESACFGTDLADTVATRQRRQVQTHAGRP